MSLFAAIDAALNHSGYCIHNDTRLITAGVFVADPKQSLQDKLLTIGSWISNMIVHYGIEKIILEGCYVAHNARTSYTLALVHGTIMYTASLAGVGVIVMPPSRVRRIVTGKGNASKKEVASVISALYEGVDLNSRYASDITDALAIGYAYIQEAVQ